MKGVEGGFCFSKHYNDMYVLVLICKHYINKCVLHMMTDVISQKKEERS